MNPDFFRILHLADSAFPIGGFAYSNGMEFAVKSGMINDLEGLENYLKEYVNQLLSFDLVFVKNAFGAEGLDELSRISEIYNAMLLNPAVKKAGLTLGKNWLNALLAFDDKNEISWPGTLAPDFPLVYGRLCCQSGFEINDVYCLYLYMSVRDQLSAVIRLGTLGPTQAHKIQSRLLDRLVDWFDPKEIGDVEQAVKSAYMVEMAQLSHKNLYAKLFQN